VSQREKKRRAPSEENPFMRLCYTALSNWGTMELEIDEAMWCIKWRNQEIEDAKKK